MKASSPQGDYALVRRVDRMIFTAGFTPRTDGEVVYKGTLGLDASEADALEAARLATSRCISAIISEIGSGKGLQIEELVVFVRAEASVSALSPVGDAASAAIRELLDQTAPPVRAVVGVAALPGGALVEVKMLATIPQI